MKHRPFAFLLVSIAALLSAGVLTFHPAIGTPSADGATTAGAATTTGAAPARAPTT